MFVFFANNSFSFSFFRYKKPTDYKRKKLNLLTVKPLFLHLKLLINI